MISGAEFGSILISNAHKFWKLLNKFVISGGTEVKKKTSSIHMRLSPEDAVVLNHLSTQAGTSPTNFARELVKAGLHTETNEIVNKSTSIDEIVGAAMDIRIVKLENRIAELLIKSMIFSLESKGIALNMMVQFLEYQNLPPHEVQRIIAHMKKVVHETAVEKVKSGEV